MSTLLGGENRLLVRPVGGFGMKDQRGLHLRSNGLGNAGQGILNREQGVPADV